MWSATAWPSRWSFVAAAVDQGFFAYLLLVRHPEGRYASAGRGPYLVAHFYSKPWRLLRTFAKNASWAALPLAQLCAANRYLKGAIQDHANAHAPIESQAGSGGGSSGDGANGGMCLSTMRRELTELRAALREAPLPAWPLCLTECDGKTAQGTRDNQCARESPSTC